MNRENNTTKEIVMSMETDARSYAPGAPPMLDPALQRLLEERDREAAARVQAYQAALMHAAANGRLTEEYAAELAARDDMLGEAAASWSATALAVFTRHLVAAQRSAKAWSSGKSDRSSEVIVFKRLIDDAAAKVQIDLMWMEH